MHVWGLVLAIAACGCGRVAFDAASDDVTGDDGGPPRVCTTPIGHDEDGDAVDDACDGCPHIADATQPDRDGDGVDDACDPEPENPRQTIAFFDPMTGPRAELVSDGAVLQYGGDAVRVDSSTGFAAVSMDGSVETDTIEWGGHVEIGSGDTHQITILGSDLQSGAFFYCELLGEPSGFHWRLTYTYDQSDFEFVGSQDLAGTFTDTDLTFRMSRLAPIATCNTTWPGADPQSGATPTDIHGDELDLGFSNVIVTMNYLVRIHTAL